MLRRVMVSIFLIFCILPVQGQSGDNPQPGVFEAISGSALVPLENATATIVSRSGGFMVASAHAAYQIEGAKAPVRFRRGMVLTFVEGPSAAVFGDDPSSAVVLRKLTATKKYRQAVFMNAKAYPFGGKSSTDLMSGRVAVTVTREKDGWLRIVASNVSPGEYALSAPYGLSWYCFGVD